MSARRAILLTGVQAGLLAATAGLAPWAHASNTQDARTEQRMRAFLGAPRLVGGHRFTYWGFDVYDASLWASATFVPEVWDRQDLVLELRYLRDFKGADIAQRSIDEMHAQRALSPAQKQNWTTALQSLIPDVRSGERLTGVYTPDQGLQLLHQDRLRGVVRDSELARRFFGIWLAPETSQRQLRQRLLAGANP